MAYHNAFGSPVEPDVNIPYKGSVSSAFFLIVESTASSISFQQN